MRAVLIESFGEAPRIADVPEPTPAEHGVVVRVDATGLCRSDWHAWAGHDTDAPLPLVPGHELAGTIAAVGRDVRRWRIGQRVTVPFVCGCGTCAFCRAGDAQVCPHQTQPGFTGWGSYAELVALDHADFNLVEVPNGVTQVAAASLGCRFATAYRALVGRARVQPGEWVAVLGCGGVGLSAVMIAVALGARVVATDPGEQALALATELGAEAVLDAAAVDVPAAIADLTDGGTHVALDAVGSERTCAESVLSLRRRGRQVQVGLLPGVQGHPRVPMDRVVAYELDLLGSHGMAAADYPEMLELVAEGRLAPARLVTRTIGLDQAAAELPLLGSRAATGVTVVLPHTGG
ncbi:MAG TPA: zinc-dependent alcohol dehydrogenase family protein [Actinomycetales bacterium]|nr:zinc-dependent alcohol dehydrogenase family protein [Actinomycetales bacterium]